MDRMGGLELSDLGLNDKIIFNSIIMNLYDLY